jgi:hypothetical protein
MGKIFDGFGPLDIADNVIDLCHHDMEDKPSSDSVTCSHPLSKLKSSDFAAEGGACLCFIGSCLCPRTKFNKRAMKMAHNQSSVDGDPLSLLQSKSHTFCCAHSSAADLFHILSSYHCTVTNRFKPASSQVSHHLLFTRLWLRDVLP